MPHTGPLLLCPAGGRRYSMPLTWTWYASATGSTTSVICSVCHAAPTVTGKSDGAKGAKPVRRKKSKATGVGALARTWRD
jgi:hypothetical protein